MQLVPPAWTGVPGRRFYQAGQHAPQAPPALACRSFPVPKSRRRGGAPQNGPIFFQEETFPSLFPLRSPCPHFRWFVVEETNHHHHSVSELEIIKQAATPSFLVRIFSYLFIYFFLFPSAISRNFIFMIMYLLLKRKKKFLKSEYREEINYHDESM